MPRWRRAAKILIVMMLAITSQAYPAEPDMQVLESNVPSIAIGSWVTETQMRTLPAGARVKVLLPSHKTRLFEVPPVHPFRSWGGTRGPTQ
jgi:hypothetical protein